MKRNDAELNWITQSDVTTNMSTLYQSRPQQAVSLTMKTVELPIEVKTIKVCSR